MNMIKVSFMVLPEVYRMLQVAAARASVALPVYVRDAVFQVSQIDAASLSAQPDTRMPRLTPTKRDILRLLQSYKAQNAGAPYMTTGQIKATLRFSDQGIYINVRTLLREGLIERGDNLSRTAEPGAPLKTYTITDLGDRSLSDDQARVQTANDDYNERSQAAYDALTPVPQGVRPDDRTFKPNVHAALRYIAMAQLGRAIESEADVTAMRAAHVRLCEAADMDVTSGAHSYGQILEKVAAKIETLGGFDAISDRFNIG